MKADLRSVLLSLIDRRMLVTLVVVLLLFLLAHKSTTEPKAAIEAITWVSIVLIGSNAAQRSLIAFSKRSVKRKQPTVTSDK
jgi:hypothetical protein